MGSEKETLVPGSRSAWCSGQEEAGASETQRRIGSRRGRGAERRESGRAIGTSDRRGECLC